MLLNCIRDEWRSICGLTLIFLITAVSLYTDLAFPNDKYWFQRSGALITIASVWFQYQKIANSWAQAFENEINNIPTKTSSESGQGISMRAMAQEGWDSRDFIKRIHNMITAKSKKDVISLLLVVAGTLIWAYGDLPFRI
ncbi:hypothetical protein ACET8J_04395 [Aeromonas veronii]|uniref:hypothetical protein n=1 Tax=Aeromonas TaxID=642 RepID=UPI000DE59A2E|nr:hypothetical protein [Aeromonas veronii]MBL0476295.1 hypothetical protein [Aeromonas veronii]MCF5842758.1 hypothetical protein [Aeromonas veronii]